ncbi:hypothetical protein ACVWYF_003752 [Hymenobacter sp. UYAg731]
MRIILMIWLAFFVESGAYAQTAATPRFPATGRLLADFIPAGYDTLRLGYATGDLNHDDRPDVAALLYAATADSSNPADGPPPRLIILFGTATGYALVESTAHAVLCDNCGGQGSDPFSSLRIRAGVLIIEHFTYTGWYRRTVARFRYQHDTFYLIGELTEAGRNDGDCPNLAGPAGWNYRDTNFVTGDYQFEEISEDCKRLAKKRGRSKPTPLRRLADYTVEP